MKRITHSMTFACLVFFSGLGIATAQDEAGPSLTATEVYGCKYNDRQGPDDLDDAVEEWNDWMDANSPRSYFAWTFTPHYDANSPDVDFLWLGVAPNAAALGAHTDRSISGGASAPFAEVADCAVHLNVASLLMKPGTGAPSDNLVISIANCKVADGRAVDDVISAGLKWGAYEIENGMKSPSWIWFPVFGGGAVDVDFRLIKGYSGGHTQLGQETDWYYSTQQWNAARRTFAGLAQCDVPRVYNGTLRRYVAPE